MRIKLSYVFRVHRKNNEKQEAKKTGSEKQQANSKIAKKRKNENAKKQKNENAKKQKK